MPATEQSQQLYVKSFFAQSIPEAMELARQELGLDALLLNSRQSPPEARHLGDYEVVFGRGQEPLEAPQATPAPLPAGRQDTGSRIDELDRLVQEIRGIIAATSQPDRTEAFSQSAPRATEDSTVERALTDAGVEPALARDIEEAVRQRMTPRAVLDITRPRLAAERDSQSWFAPTVDEMSSRIAVQPEIGRITALVGPPGSGKTTTLAKLAISQCLAAGHPVRLISADTVRIGATEQLRTYAAILGIPFQAVESTAALAQAIDSTPSNTHILIDTPGLSAALLQDLGSDLARFLSRRQDIDTHLVLTASMNSLDLRETVRRFEIFGASKLLFTRLDEATSRAAIFCEAARAKKPLSFFGNGQSVPEDLAPASKEQVIESLVSQLPKSLRSVA
jgi:flagellar biosynthesis protein FlhF